MLDQAREPERSYISNMMMSFTSAAIQCSQNGKSGAVPSAERHSNVEAEKLRKKVGWERPFGGHWPKLPSLQNSALQSEINALRGENEKTKSSEEALTRCKIELSDANERIKHFEAASTSMTAQFIQLQKNISELEFENDRIHRTMEAQVRTPSPPHPTYSYLLFAVKTQTLELLRSEKKDLTDEVETLRFRESQLQRDLKQASERQAHASERDSNALRTKEKELDFANRRLVLAMLLTETNWLELVK
jgi:hypothetical protein